MSNKWFEPGKPMGWHKTQSQSIRRANALHAHKGDYLAAARALQEIANVTKDRETARKAGADAKYFYAKHNAKVKARR